MPNLVNDFTEALLSLDQLTARKIVTKQTQRISAIKFVEEVVNVALERIGNGWQEGTVALSQVYMGGRICEKLVDEILPQAAPERKHQPKMAMGTLADHHQL